MSNFKHTRGLIIALCAVLLLTVGVVFAILSYINGWFDKDSPTIDRDMLQDYDKILPCVTICGVDVSGLTQDEATTKVAATLQAEVADEVFTVQFPDQELTIRKYLHQSVPTLSSAVREAYQHGRDGVTYLDDAIAQAEAAPLELKPAVERSVDEETIRTAVEKYAATLDARATDCRIHETENTLEITKGKDGRSLDANALCSEIIRSIDDGKTTLDAAYQLTRSGVKQLEKFHKTFCTEGSDAKWDSETASIVPEVIGQSFDLEKALKLLDDPNRTTFSVPIIRTEPAVTEAMLQERLFADELAHYDSPHTPIAPRTNNLTRACEAINGTVINPGEVFSFNDTVGERTEEKGYQDAAVYIDGETSDALGGGVCQVASTIYYCALMANLEIVERTEHMYFVTYVPNGVDATVYWGALDFRFRNSTDYPLRIDASVSGGYVHITLVGTNVDGSYAVITSETLSVTQWDDVIKEDESKPADYSEVTTTPYTGYVIRTYRNVYDKDDHLLSTELEAKSTYHKRDRVTTIGVEPKPPEPEDPGIPISDPLKPEEPEVPVDPWTADPELSADPLAPEESAPDGEAEDPQAGNE